MEETADKRYGAAIAFRFSSSYSRIRPRTALACSACDTTHLRAAAHSRPPPYVLGRRFAASVELCRIPEKGGQSSREEDGEDRKPRRLNASDIASRCRSAMTLLYVELSTRFLL